MSVHERAFGKRLVPAVMEIDKQAGFYLVKAAKYLPSFVHSGRLEACFEWAATVRGYNFWKDIYKKLIDSGYYDKHHLSVWKVENKTLIK